MSEDAKEVAPGDVKYYHWPPERFAEFVDRINREGSMNVRVEFHPGEKLWKVFPTSESARASAAKDGVEYWTFNYAETCPFNCGGS